VEEAKPQRNTTPALREREDRLPARQEDGDAPCPRRVADAGIEPARIRHERERKLPVGAHGLAATLDFVRDLRDRGPGTRQTDRDKRRDDNRCEEVAAKFRRARRRQETIRLHDQQILRPKDLTTTL
jgi:hypothetical protein